MGIFLSMLKCAIIIVIWSDLDMGNGWAEAGALMFFNKRFVLFVVLSILAGCAGSGHDLPSPMLKRIKGLSGLSGRKLVP